MQRSSAHDIRERLAVRRDPQTRVREEAMFFGPGSVKMFGYVRIPEGAVLGAVVVCPPIHEDFMRVYRKQVLLARALAARGLAVLGFHYRGTGNSEGEVQDLTYDGMLDDTRSAIQWLADRIGVGPGLVGIRWGGLMAAAAAKDSDAPMALWEPTIDPALYFREATRANTVWHVQEGLGGPSGMSFEEELRQHGSVDLLGYPVYLGLYETAGGHRLADELGDRPRSLLLVQMTRNERLRDRYATLSRGLEDRGFSVDGYVLEEEESWWFTGVRWEAEEGRTGTQELVSVTTDWVVQRVAESPS
jgi:pimeloyl-ACP methyl ester carboxylesterase